MLAGERVLGAELVEDADDRRARRSSWASPSALAARRGAGPGRARCRRRPARRRRRRGPASPSRSRRRRAASPSAAKPGRGARRAARAPRRPRRGRAAAGRARRRRRRRPGSSSSARRSEASSPASASRSASEGTSSSKKRSTAGGGWAPTNSATMRPSLKALTAGMPWMPNAPADAAGWRRCRAWRGRPRPRAPSASPRARASSARQGPHQSAQKSTTTGTVVRALQDLRLEVGFGDVDDHDLQGSRRAERRHGVDAAACGSVRGRAGDGHPRRAAARPDGDASLRGDGLAHARARRAPRDRLRRARPRRVGAAPTALRLRRAGRRPGAASSTSCEHRARGAGGRLDGRAHAAALRPRAPERVRGAGRRSRPPSTPTSCTTRRAWTAGTRWRAGCARAGWRASSPPTATPRCPATWHDTVLTVLRQRLARHEHPEARGGRAGGRCRARRPSTRSRTSAPSRAPTVVVAEPRRDRPGPPARRGRGYVDADPGRAPGHRGAGALAAGLAGRSALARDRRGGGRGDVDQVTGPGRSLRLTEWPMADVFVSYSRRDSEAVQRIVSALQERGKDVWVDVDGIRDAEVFPAALRSAVEGSDGFVFVISPDSRGLALLRAGGRARARAQQADRAARRPAPVPDEEVPESIRAPQLDPVRRRRRTSRPASSASPERARHRHRARQGAHPLAAEGAGVGG